MDIGKLGVWFFLDTMATTDAVAFVQRLEALGYPALWLPEAVGREAFAQAGVVLGRTERIVIATGLANIWARDPGGMAPGQTPLVEGVRGHAYRRPLTAMREYLARMETSPFMAVGPSEPPPTVIGAIRPKMIALAGERTQGVHTYFVPPELTARTRAGLP